MPETPIDHFNYTKSEWKSKEFLEIIDKLPENLEVVYDIGANAGGFTEVLHEKYPNAKFYCFEPVKFTYEALKEFVPYAECINKGVYYGIKESKATWRGSNIGAIFLAEVDSGEPRMLTGETLELCELEELNISKPTLIKMDIEGAEENVLMNSDICKKCPYIILEWHPDADPIKFFNKYLPYHRVVVNINNNQFLLKNTK